MTPIDVKQRTALSLRTVVVVIAYFASVGLFTLALVTVVGERSFVTAPSRSLEQLTTTISRELTTAASRRGGISVSEERSLRALLVARRREQLRLLSSDPHRVGRSLLGGKVELIPQTLLSLVEQPFVSEGVVSRLHADDESQRVVRESYELVLPSGDRRTLSSADGARLAPGARVRIEGVQIGSTLVTSGQPDDIETIEQPTVATLIGTRRVAVILINFLNNTQTPVTVDQAREKVFTAPNSANAYYQEVSFGQLALVGSTRPDGDVYGWFTIPHTDTGCQLELWAQAAREAATASGADLVGIDNFIYVTASTSQCGPYGGISELNGDETWMIGGVNPTLLSHELGHNFGADHANWLDCRNAQNQRVSLGGTCTSQEYGDSHDVMGVGQRHTSVFHKGRYGWLLAPNIVDVTAPGVYTLVPIEALPGSGAPSTIQALRVPRYSGTSLLNYFYLEFRSRQGEFDTYALTDDAVNGVTIRVAPDGATQPPPKTNIVDASPTTPAGNAALRAGQSLQDPDIGVTITTLSVTPGESATVRIDFPPCQVLSPTLTLGGSGQTVRPGSELVLTANITNHDGLGCSPVDFTLVGSLPTGWVQAPSIVSVAPKATVIVTFTITLPASISNGTYWFNEQVTAANHTAAWAWGAVTVDGTTPIVAIPTPPDGLIISDQSPLTIQGMFTDTPTNYVKRSTITIDGANVKECVNASSCSLAWDSTPVSDGTHSILVSASDAAGNTGQRSITVIKDTLPPSSPSGLQVAGPITIAAAPAIVLARVDLEDPGEGGEGSRPRLIPLAWDAADDGTSGSGVAGYKLYSCTDSGCTPSFAREVGDVTAFTFPAAVPSTSYSFEVTAVDRAGNESARSNRVTLSVP